MRKTEAMKKALAVDSAEAEPSVDSIAQRAIRLLRDIEWNGAIDYPRVCCPSCGGDESGHRSECELKSVLRDLLAVGFLDE